MTDRDGLDRLDLRLLGYLQERADIAAAFGPGADALAASIAGSGPQARRSTDVGRLPTMAWVALALVALALVALAASLAGGPRRDGPLVAVAPSTSTESPRAVTESDLVTEGMIGRWFLDFEGSRIDDAYGGSPRPDGLTFATLLTFGIPDRLEVSSGAGGGCAVRGTWTAGAGRLAIDISTAVNSCEATGPGPAAREIRRRLAQVRTYARAGDRLTLFDDTGATLLTFRGPPEAWSAGPLQLDFEASGIPGYYTVALRKNERVPVSSWLDLSEPTVTGGTGAGGGCDAFTGIVHRDGQALSISIPVAPGHCGPEFPDLDVRQRLVRASSFAIVEDTFRLYDADGKQLLVYRAMESATPAP
jgi:hypothetical protein